VQIWEKLLEKAFGGQDVAAAPDVKKENIWPLAPAVAGSTMICEKFSEEVNNATTSNKHITWLFLVGSAGNGKSELAKLVADATNGKLEDYNSKYAQRKYRYQVESGVSLDIINDATIPPEVKDNNSGFLLNDIYESIDKKSYLLGCINRGILLKEKKHIIDNLAERNDIEDLACELIDFLLESENEYKAVHINDNYHKVTYFNNASFEHDGFSITVNVIYMDQASLLEDEVIHQFLEHEEGHSPVELGKYKVRLFEKNSLDRKQTPAFKLATNVVSLVDKDTKWQDSEIQSPLQANLEFFREEKLLNGWLNILRSAEICSGSRYTYRDLWGILVLSLVGTFRSEYRKTSNTGGYVNPKEWVDALVNKVEMGGTLEDVSTLANMRIHMSIFGEDPIYASTHSKENAESGFSAIKSLLRVDPISDSTPDSEVAVAVKDAMDALAYDDLPSSYLFTPESGYEKAWTVFDSWVERKVIDAIKETKKDNERRQYEAWLGRYLYRLYALASGHPAFFKVVKEWVEAWNRANENRDLQDVLTLGLEQLISGSLKSTSRDSILLPVLSPKADVFTDMSSQPYLALKIPSVFSFLPRNQGDHVIIAINNQNNPVAKVPLDFPLCREILVNSNPEPGFTELSHLASPRIERVRAAMLTDNYVKASDEQGMRRHDLVVMHSGNNPISIYTKEG